MASLLRSNQPIAWASVPFTAILLAGWVHGGGAEALVRAGVATALAGLLHRIYVGNEYVKRGDPALSWLFVSVWLLGTPVAPGTVGDGWNWAAAACALVGAELLLRMYRQGRVSDLTFRAGAAAGVAAALDPIQGGFLLALGITLGFSRPFQWREWVLLFVGTAWTASLGGAIRWWVLGTVLPAEEPAGWGWAGPGWTAFAIAAGILSLLGLLLLSATMKRVSFRSQTARNQTTLLFFSAATVLGIGGWIVRQTGGPTLDWQPSLGLYISFFTAFCWVWWMPGGHGDLPVWGRKKRWLQRLRWGLLLVSLGLAAWAQWRDYRTSSEVPTTESTTPFPNFGA